MSLKNIKLGRINIADICSCFKVFQMRLGNYFGGVIFASMALFSADASTADIPFGDVSSGYSACSFYEGLENYDIELTIAFKPIEGRIGAATIPRGRGVALYTYNSDGSLDGALRAEYVAINDFKSRDVSYTADAMGYKVHWDYGCSLNVWCTNTAFSARVKLRVQKTKFAGWPAIGVRAVNVGTTATNIKSTHYIGEVQGLAYISPNTKNGQCVILNNPENPPMPVTPNITMSAPDWDLGELPRGEETELTLPATKDQLCFSYEGSTALSNQKFLINATNIHGVSGDGRYLLKSLLDSSQTVPYTLTLANSKNSVLLPNTQSRLFSLDTGGRTCFTPTFKAQPDPTVKAGAYSDILTFTVVAKP